MLLQIFESVVLIEYSKYRSNTEQDVFIRNIQNYEICNVFVNLIDLTQSKMTLLKIFEAMASIKYLGLNTDQDVFKK